MNGNSSTNNRVAAAAAKLCLQPGAGLGVEKPDFYGDPIFRRALLMILLFSSVTTILMTLHHMGIIETRVKNLYVVLVYPVYLMGSLKLNGDLTAKRRLGVGLNMLALPAWQYAVYGNSKLYTLSFPIAVFIVITWAVFLPQIVERMGIRPRLLLKDLLVALAISLAVSLYTFLGMKAWGFPLERVELWPTLAHTSSLLAENTLGACLYFSVWAHMRKKGIYLLESIGVLLCMALTFQAPFLPYHLLSGAAGTFPLIASVVFISLVMTLIMAITFTRLKNVLPAAILITVLFELARGAGVL